MSYQDIYQEIWRIFSYLSAITAALLVFGTQLLATKAAVAAATIPLIFWFLGVYIPMDRYGNMRCKRLAQIEEELSNDYNVNLRHFRTLTERSTWGSEYGRGWRVRSAVKVFGTCLILTFLVSLGLAFSQGQFIKTAEPARFQGKVELTPPVVPLATEKPPKK